MATKEKTKAPEKALKVELPVIQLKKGVVLQEDFDHFISVYKEQMNGVRRTALKMSWELGAHIHAILDDAVYGDHKIEEVCEELETSKSSLYGYKRLYDVYEKADIERFMKHDIGFHSVYQLLRLKDDVVRKELENKLIKGLIKSRELSKLINDSRQSKSPEISQAPTQNMQVDGSNPEDEDESEVEEDIPPEKAVAEESLEEAQAEEGAKGSVKASANKIRSVMGRIEVLATSLDGALDRVPEAIDAFDLIDDMKISEALQGRVGSVNNTLYDLKVKMIKICEELKKVAI